MTHKIVVVYQSLLGIYGDRGNAKVLLKRLQWRGEPAELVDVEPGQPLPPDGLVYLLGGGEDQAQIAAVAAECIAEAGLADRVVCMAGDYHADTFAAESFDAATIFGALHQEEPAEILAILRRAHAALKPGGRLFVLDMMTDASHASPAFSALFAVNMALTTTNGWVFSDAELKALMAEAGFEPGETRPVPPPMPHWLVSAVKR